MPACQASVRCCSRMLWTRVSSAAWPAVPVCVAKRPSGSMNDDRGAASGNSSMTDSRRAPCPTLGKLSVAPNTKIGQTCDAEPDRVRWLWHMSSDMQWTSCSTLVRNCTLMATPGAPCSMLAPLALNTALAPWMRHTSSRDVHLCESMRKTRLLADLPIWRAQLSGSVALSRDLATAEEAVRTDGRYVADPGNVCLAASRK